MKFILAIAMLALSANYCASQVTTISVKEWVKKLSDPKDIQNEAMQLLYEQVITKYDSTRLDAFVKQLEANGDSNNIYFSTRLKIVKLSLLQLKDHLNGNKASKVPTLLLIKEAMQLANESQNEYLIANVSNLYFSIAFFYDEKELAVTYSIYSIELHERLVGIESYPNYHFVGELMYRVREYEKCKEYSLKWLSQTANTKSEGNKAYRMSVYNTLALAYHRTNNYDSAMYFYKKALAETSKYLRAGWEGIISGNMGQVYYLLKKYDSAIALLDKDYRISMDNKFFDNAANALQWSARAHIAIGKSSLALPQIREAMLLINKLPDDNYRQNIYYAAVDVYKLNGFDDSAIYYSGLYQKLHDSIEKRIATSSIAISNLRLNEEKNLYNIRRLKQEKNAQLQQRNFVILGIVLLAIITVLLVNWQRLKFKYRKESLEKEKILMEAEMLSAKLQMEQFTQNIVEKTNLIEKLEVQMLASNSSAGQQETISALSSLTILTEGDWDKFKELFEKIYPMFFQRLKDTAPDITVAEQRMAALTRLQLTTRQMASMQGISPDSVHKTRQRLRQRMGVSNDTNLEEFFSSI